jgi:hypothetical protein
LPVTLNLKQAVTIAEIRNEPLSSMRADVQANGCNDNHQRNQCDA